MYEGPRSDHIKLIDFGFAACWDSDTHCSKDCGTPGFAAPEVFRAMSYTDKVDMFSMGVIIYGLLTVEEVFGPIRSQVLDRNRDFRPVWNSDLVGSLSEDAQ